ncbi:MAG: PIG-L family deacetylase [Chloroflexota bacterium]|nr:PIG-L family deacetylase [Chloroflexota bacterium]
MTATSAHNQDAPCIMVIGAHAADAELMGGAAVLAHQRQGWRSVLVHLTLGEKGSKTLSAEEYAGVKREEAARAAGVLGAELEVLPYLDGELPVSDEVQWHIADLIRKHRPDVILTHWKGSIHTDHTNCYENVLGSLFFARLKTFVREYPNHYPKAIYFAENWEDQEDFAPEVYFDTSEDWETYQKAAACYTLISGEGSPFRYLQWYDGASRARGAERHLDRAVALMPYRPFYSRRRTLDSLA